MLGKFTPRVSELEVKAGTNDVMEGLTKSLTQGGLMCRWRVIVAKENAIAFKRKEDSVVALGSVISGGTNYSTGYDMCAQCDENEARIKKPLKISGLPDLTL